MIHQLTTHNEQIISNAVRLPKLKKRWHFKDERLHLCKKSDGDKVNTEDNYKSVCPILEAEVPQNLPNWTEINILEKRACYCILAAAFTRRSPFSKVPRTIQVNKMPDSKTAFFVCSVQGLVENNKLHSCQPRPIPLLITVWCWNDFCEIGSVEKHTAVQGRLFRPRQ